MFEEGATYTGMVMKAYLDLAYDSEYDVDAIFMVSTEEGQVKCKHPLYGEKKDRSVEVLMLFGVDLEHVEDVETKAVGKEVDVWVGFYKGKPFGKINVGGRRMADEEKMAAAIRRLKGLEEEPPF